MKKRRKTVLLVLLFFIAFSRQVNAFSQLVIEETNVSFLGNSMTDQYSTRDVTYPSEANGFNSLGIYERREKQVQENSASFCKIKNGILEITSQVWKEEAPAPFYAYYQNTTQLYWKAENGDYDVEVTLINPTLTPYSAFLRSGTQSQSWTKTVSPGYEVTLEGRFSVVDGELSLDILPFSEARSLMSAQLQTVYVKNIRITKLKQETKGENPTLYLVGDSTSSYYKEEKFPREGWGQEIYHFFKGSDHVTETSYAQPGFLTSYLNGYREYKMEDITIENWSVPGESTRTFLESGKWDGILNKVCPGDYVFVQFGHNDSEKTKGVKYTSIEEYKENLRFFMKGCRQRGAICVFLSPIPKCVFTSKGICKPWANEYRKAMKEVASDEKIPFLDIGSIGAKILTEEGKKKAKSYYMIVPKGKYEAYPDGKKDRIHLQQKGAKKYARIVADCIREEKRLKELAGYLKREKKGRKK